MIQDDCIVRAGALSETPRVFAKYWDGNVPLVIADRNTWAVAGQQVATALRDAGHTRTETFVFPDEQEVYADDTHVATVRALLEGNDRIAVAVGSGTINDLVKRASAECGKQYLIVATAPSVDGYTAFGAAITVRGFKTTLPCAPPAAVVADTTILCAAPAAMIASGYGDLAAKVPAGADWQIADLLGIDPIARMVWDMVQIPLRPRLADPRGLAQREAVAVTGLFEGLAQVGYAMQIHKDSRPASGSEHLMSHIWEMEHVTVAGKAASHGFKVAVGTLASTALLTELAALSRQEVEASIASHRSPSLAERLEQLDRLFPNDPSKEATVRAATAKFLHGTALAERQRLIASRWDELRRRVVVQIIPFDELKAMFRSAGCPVEPAQVGLDRAALERGMRKAQAIRVRYTALDLAYETGLLDPLLATVARSPRYFSKFLD